MLYEVREKIRTEFSRRYIVLRPSGCPEYFEIREPFASEMEKDEVLKENIFSTVEQIALNDIEIIIK